MHAKVVNIIRAPYDGFSQPRSQGFSLEGGWGPTHLQGKSPGNEVGFFRTDGTQWIQDPTIRYEDGGKTGLPAISAAFFWSPWFG